MANSQSTNVIPSTVSTMTKAHPHNLLDLPAELRLMIYEQLSFKITHHRIPNTATIVVLTTLPGVQLLATCRQIRFEATAILSDKLNAILTQPVRLIVSRMDDENLCGLLIAAANRTTTRGSYSPWIPSCPPDLSDSKSQQVCVAILNNSPPTCAMWEECSNLLDQIVGLHRTLTRLHSQILRDLDVRMRPALMSEDKKLVYRHFPPGVMEWMWKSFPESQPQLFLRDGAEIAEEEWEKDWVEGERLDL